MHSLLLEEKDSKAANKICRKISLLRDKGKEEYLRMLTGSSRNKEIKEEEKVAPPSHDKN